MMVEPPMLLPLYKTILETLVNNPVVPYLEPLVALHVTSRSLGYVRPVMVWMMLFWIYFLSF